MFRLRALSFVIGLPLMLAVCYAGGWWLFGVTLILAFLGLREWHRAVASTSARPNHALGGLFLLAFLLVTHLLAATPERLDANLVLLVVAAVGTAFISRIVIRGGQSALADIGATLLAPLYLGLLFSFLLRIRAEPWAAPAVEFRGLFLEPGFCFAVLLFLTCWLMDTGAYLCGRFIGGPKLCPAVSPGKTIAGFIGALLTAALTVAVGFALCRLPVLQGLVLGALMGLVGQLGDLGKSLIKREAGIKDFGLIFPGHGGVLDRFDNFLFNAPLLFYCLKCLLSGEVW